MNRFYSHDVTLNKLNSQNFDETFSNSHKQILQNIDIFSDSHK